MIIFCYKNFQNYHYCKLNICMAFYFTVHISLKSSINISINSEWWDRCMYHLSIINLKCMLCISVIFCKFQQQGAATTIFCAVSSQLDGVGGLYFNNCCRCVPSRAGCDENLALRLWNLSERMLQKALDQGIGD